MSNLLALFVPATPTAEIATTVVPKSAIVGSDTDDEYIVVDFEGAIYGPVNIKTYADRARHAAGRHITRYPTIARMRVARNDLTQVGWIDEQGGITLFDETRGAVAAWLGVEQIAPEELQFSS